MPKLIGDLIGSLGDFTPFFNFSSEDWLEAVALYSPAQMSMGRKRSSATLTGYVPFDRLQDCFKYLIGFSYVSTDTGFPALHRSVPSTHPWDSNLFATEIIEAVGVKFISKVAKPHKWSLPYANYTLARVTVHYSQPPYDILADADIDMSSAVNYRGQEMRRWFWWNPKAYVEQLELPGGFVVFDTPNTTITPPGGGSYSLDGTQIPGPRQVYRFEKVRRRATWYNVPIEFFSDQYGFFKSDKALSKINSLPFFADSTAPPGADGAPHTWLLEDVDTVNNEIYADPIVSAVFSGMTRRMDLIFTFCHFNPPRGLTSNPECGWRLTLAADGLWYPQKYKATGAAFDYPREYDFGKLFTHYLDT